MNQLTSVWDLLSRFNNGELIGLVAVVGGFVFVTFVSIVKVIGRTWRGIREAEIAAALKRDMLERGMSAEDIRSVIEAGSKGICSPFKSRHSCRT